MIQVKVVYAASYVNCSWNIKEYGLLNVIYTSLRKDIFVVVKDLVLKALKKSKNVPVLYVLGEPCFFLTALPEDVNYQNCTIVQI